MMTVESIPGRGSTFSFTAYFEIPDEQVEEQARESSFIPLLDESLRILLAEDNKVNQKLALKLLEKADHQITVANNGREAVDYCEAIEFDIIFMDIQMPIMGGEEAVELIRAKEKKSGTHTPIVALTAHAMKGDKERYLSHGMDGYVSKPIKRAELFSVIEDLVTKSRESDTKHQSEYPE